MMVYVKLFILFMVIAMVSSELHFSIYKLECINDKDTNYTTNITCFLKTISRGLNVLTSLSDFVEPVHFIIANIVVLQKSSANTYRSVIINNTFNVCEMLGDRAPPMLKFCLPLMSKFAPDFIHPCPYQGRNIGVVNLPIDFSLLPLVSLSNVPKGDYRVDINFYDKYRNIIYWIKLYGAIQQKRFKKKHSDKPSYASTIPPNDATETVD